VTSSFASRESPSRSLKPSSWTCSSKTASTSTPIYVIATEKAEQEIEAGASGTVLWTGEVGATYNIGGEIGVIKS